MAKRSRKHRSDIPGYDENRPSRDERKQKHRATRHATHQILNTYDDPDEVLLPEERRTRKQEANGVGNNEPEKKRYRVWKTKFWKRRDGYRSDKAAMDAEWPVITPEQLPEDR